MEKLELIRKMRKEAVETARTEKKINQFLFLFIPLLVILLAGFTLIYWGVLPSRDGKSFAALVGGVTLLGASSLFILPFGKISEEKIDKYFKQKLLQKIKDDEEEAIKTEKRSRELDEEMKILKEI